jgi:hypothetical protein
MTTALHLPPRLDVPIACDMTGATDTPDQRLADYGRLFERGPVRCERRRDGVVFRFRAEPGIRDMVEDLARREAACCPFFEYRIETTGDALAWTVTNPLGGEPRATADVILDAFYRLPELTAPTRRGRTGGSPAAGFEALATGSGGRRPPFTR